VSDEYGRLRRALGDEPLPAALLDLDAVDHNLGLLVRPARASGKALRVATKSLRCVALLRYLLDRGGGVIRGLMAYDAREVAFLVERGFDDILLPTVQRSDVDLLAGLAAGGASVSVVVDDPAHLAALDAAGERKKAVIDVVIEVDMALRAGGGRVHLGVQRSPLRTAAEVGALAGQVAARRHLRLAGVMGYEAQVAGLGDRSPGAPLLGGAKRLIKALSRPMVARRRGEIAREFSRRGLPLRIFNGGGTGSLRSSAKEAHLTELTAGSGFVTSHLFDHYDDLPLRPALGFALQVVRTPGPGLVTCAGGGYVASGEAGPEKLPRPWLPAGLSLLPREGAGEVQTPLRVPEGVRLGPGDPVFFRHAKAGELAERFARYHFVRGEQIVETHPTYRGEGACFL
jgi:D-serine deaminase-like pyridoxal phosphate-dependent protein